jgi:hypothetical protein
VQEIRFTQVDGKYRDDIGLWMEGCGVGRCAVRRAFFGWLEVCGWRCGY